MPILPQAERIGPSHFSLFIYSPPSGVVPRVCNNVDQEKRSMGGRVSCNGGSQSPRPPSQEMLIHSLLVEAYENINNYFYYLWGFSDVSTCEQVGVPYNGDDGVIMIL